jgi:hypothetical protein
MKPKSTQTSGYAQTTIDRYGVCQSWQVEKRPCQGFRFFLSNRSNCDNLAGCLVHGVAMTYISLGLGALAFFIHKSNPNDIITDYHHCQNLIMFSHAFGEITNEQPDNGKLKVFKHSIHPRFFCSLFLYIHIHISNNISSIQSPSI